MTAKTSLSLLLGALLLGARARAAETELSIVSDAGAPAGVCALGATLDRPARAKAIVVFAAGSGPQDRDENIGEAAPLRDLAKALEERGIATLRYDKRGSKNDACRASVLNAQVSPENFIADYANVYDRAAQEGLPVFALGHSEGVTYAIEAASRGRIAPRGLVLLAGLGRYSLDQTVLRQLEKGLPGTADALRQGLIFFARLQAGQAADDEKYLGAYARFWREEIALTARASAAAAAVGRPSLLVQGSRDANVTREDFDALSSALAPAAGESVMLDGLDHFFLKPDETAVDPRVAAAIAVWIEARLPAPSVAAVEGGTL